MNYIENLMEFVEKSVSPFHAVNHAAGRLTAAGFQALDFSEPWQLEKGKAYFCKVFSGELFAFKTSEDFDPHCGAHILGAHTDWPCLQVKPSASFTKGGYLQVNAAIYGGLTLHTFFDRPLSIAGKLAVKSDNLLHPTVQYIDIEKTILTLPNLAIHMNRDVNEQGLKIDKQVHLMPILGIVEDVLNTDNYLINYIAQCTGVSAEDILDYELYIYNAEKPCFIGINDTFISAPRLDNITSVCAGIDALIEAEPQKALAMTVLFDNEEIGSTTKQGADSAIFLLILEKIWNAFGRSRIQTMEDLHQSMILSSDVAHGYHPNYSGIHDITNIPILGKGVCIKTDSNQKYTWDCEASGGLKQLCQVIGAPYQMCVKRTGALGGSTIGPMLSALLPVKTVDIGVPLLAMHSARELMGTNDQIALTRTIQKFFSV